MSLRFPPDCYSFLTKGIDANGNPIVVDKTPSGLLLTGTRDATHPVTHPENKGLNHIFKSILGSRDPKADPDPGVNPVSHCPNCSLEDGIASIPCQIQKTICETKAGIGGGFNTIGKGVPTVLLIGGGILLLAILLHDSKRGKNR